MCDLAFRMGRKARVWFPEVKQTAFNVDCLSVFLSV